MKKWLMLEIVDKNVFEIMTMLNNNLELKRILYIYMYIYIYILYISYIYTYIHTYICVYICIYVYVYLFLKSSSAKR